MYTEKEIIKIATEFVIEIENRVKIELVLTLENTIKKPYGLVFFYTSKKFNETKDYLYAVAGNAPFLVENKTGKVIEFSTSDDIDFYLVEYEAGRWPNNKRLDF